MHRHHRRSEGGRRVAAGRRSREHRDRDTRAGIAPSALERLAVCFTAADLDYLLPVDVRVSAEDSLEEPTSKLDPAVYTYAAHRFGIEPAQALAIEDAVSGVRSAVAAGVTVIGNLHFVAPSERDEREAALLDAGAAAVVAGWDEVVDYLTVVSAPCR